MWTLAKWPLDDLTMTEMTEMTEMAENVYVIQDAADI